MTPDEARRRTKDYGERHPAKARANDFVNALHESQRTTESISAERAAAELFVRYSILSDLFEAAGAQLENHVFTLLLKIMQASFDLGRHSAPDGRAARASRTEQSLDNFNSLVSTVLIYLEAHPKLEPKASEKFANIIRPDLLELAGKSRKSPSQVPPSISAIVRALRAVRKKSLAL